MRSLPLTATVGLLLLSLLPSIAVRAQESGVQVTQVSTDNWPEVSATVTVLDGAGQPLTGLESSAFGASIDGSALPVTNVTTVSDEDEPIAVVLAFDVSGSMAGAPLEARERRGRGAACGAGPG
jgi:hypothetical protein